MLPHPSEVVDLTRSSPDNSKHKVENLNRDSRESSGPRYNDGADRQTSTLGKKRKRELEPNRGGRKGETSNRNSKQRGGDGVNTRGDEYGSSGEAKPSAGQRRSNSYSPERERISSPPPSEIFFIDTKPALVSSNAHHKHVTNGEVQEAPVLLLPAHVSVFGEVPFEILPPSTSEADNEDYIEYLDYDDRKDLVRYFEDPVDVPVKPSRTVCKNCGAEGEHKTAACPILICLTCGARNEHLTRSCPISKTCYTCGMKGHINSSCPNRHKRNAKYEDCDRCGSLLHQCNECPTLWRLYEYFTDEERERVVKFRQGKKDAKLGQGGEGYIADDEWCYNCGNLGHWGDDCNEMPHPYDFPKEPSTFSTHNTSSGPFFNSGTDAKKVSHPRAPRLWERLDAEWDIRAPENVGKQGRRKQQVKLQKRVQEQEADDPDDWFGRENGVRDRQRDVDTRAKVTPTAPKKMTFGLSVKGAARQSQSQDNPRPPPRSLLDRLDLGSERGSRRDGETPRPPPDRDSRRSSRNNSYNHRERNDRSERTGGVRDSREQGYERDYRGPRYQGGYRR